MRNVFFDRRRAERFAQLLDEANGGPRHHTRNQFDEQLAELVAVGHELSGTQPDVEIDPEFRVSLRAMLVATAEREGVGVSAQTDSRALPAVVTARTAKILGAGTPDGAGRRLRARGAIVVGVVAGAVAVSGMSAASENAYPGDALYGVKRSTERAQLALATSNVARGQLFLDFARTRLGEAGAAVGNPAGFATVLGDMDTDTTQGTKLLTTAAVQERDRAPLEVLDSFVTDQRYRISSLLPLATETARERALSSLRLLEKIGKRAHALRSTVLCGPSHTVRVDSLGPQPHRCNVSAGTTAEEKSSPKQRSPKDKNTDSEGDHPAHPTEAPSPSLTSPRTGETNVAVPSTASSSPDGEKPEKGLGQLLGDLLGY